MTREALRCVIFGVAAETEYQFVSSQGLCIVSVSGFFRVGVGLSGSVAGFATHRRVVCLAELREFRLMTGAASVVPHRLTGSRTALALCDTGAMGEEEE